MTMETLEEYRRLIKFERKGVELNDEEVKSMRTIGGGICKELKGKKFDLALRYRYNTYLRLIFGLTSKYHYKQHKNKLFIWRIE